MNIEYSNENWNISDSYTKRNVVNGRKKSEKSQRPDLNKVKEIKLLRSKVVFNRMKVYIIINKYCK